MIEVTITHGAYPLLTHCRSKLQKRLYVYSFMS